MENWGDREPGQGCSSRTASTSQGHRANTVTRRGATKVEAEEGEWALHHADAEFYNSPAYVEGIKAVTHLALVFRSLKAMASGLKCVSRLG